MDERVRSRGSVRVLDEDGQREGFCSLSHAETLVSEGMASFTSETRRCVQRKPPNPAQSGEERKGRLRIRQSGRYGPMVVQVESAAEEFNS
jgi:hypothetical protein